MPTDQLPLEIRLREDATFANYIGKAPQLFAGEGVYLVFGEAGSGKSHLLQAVCHDARAAGRIAFFLDEPFRHEATILDGLQSMDVICIDALDALLGNESWETALFHLINSVRDGGGTIVLAVSQTPAELEATLPDLGSRLLAANAVETDVLSDGQKLRLLQEKARRQGFDLSEDVGRFILTRAQRSPRALIDLLAKIEMATLARQRKVTIPLVKSVLGS